MRWLIIITLFYSLLSFAEEAEQAPETKPDEFAKIEQMEVEMAELYKESLDKVGTAKNIIDMQMLKKNEDIRAELQKLIKNRTEQNTPKVTKFVNEQVEYLTLAIDFLSKRITTLQNDLDEVELEQKLITQKTLNETNAFYHTILSEQWVNFEWLELLGSPADKSKQALIRDIEQRLDFLSAKLSFDNQQESVLASQIKSAADEEKDSLQLQYIFAQRDVSSDIDNLQFIVDLANKMKIDTTDYTKQLFVISGNLTNELLDYKVILSLLSDGLKDFRDWLGQNTPQALFKIFIFLLIIFIFKILKNVTRHIVTRAVSPPTLRMSQLMKDFFISISGNTVLCIGILIALSQIGLNLAPVLTGFGVAGVIIGFALQDTLSNFASGMMLLIYRPFDVDDFVEAGGTSGKVSHMSLVSTTIKTFDNQILIVPNSKIWGDTIKNITHEKVRRVDMVFGVSYGDDIEKTETVLEAILADHPMVLRSPEPTIKLHILNSSSVDFIVRPWVKTEDYWDVYWDVTREVKMRFDREGISIPFPQQDVHLHMIKNEDIPK
ncbi:mechanosensitive ion channel family protein [Photobacterium lutimaris]|uniref:Small-conductance mechanosensitive channel n=1 Tax=Photobacterium lutimaris TaxID=388278 RepID=A0A2T3J1R9_9GAMM|nr:mechanosensitive ion channel family protein [Photobacterium lutimaris]PSU34990.1 mechanosensitive ion channel protein MscS [Photobacterium lutimaris]TDR77345.1 small conductance mechanosensitive channel [Photobacterium lutimaris]